MKKYKNFLQLLSFCFFVSCSALAQDVAPPEFSKIAKSSYLIGSANLNFVGLKVYKISLWCDAEKFSYNQKFAIQILYNMNFTKEELAKRSIEEIKRFATLDQKQETQYYNQLMAIFSNIRKGDEKIAIFDPQNGVSLFHNHNLNGKITDLKFARLFVDIWLNDKNSYPQVTKKLLGNYTKT